MPAANLVGRADAGMAEISLPMRAIEDALATASLAGAVAAEVRAVAEGLDGEVDRDALPELGGLLGKADALAALAMHLAGELDRDDGAPERLNPVSAGFRGFVVTLQAEIDAFAEQRGVVLSVAAGLLRRDLVKSLAIAGTAHRPQAAKRAAGFVNAGEGP